LGAIQAGSDRKAKIDYDKCVQCGSCKVACQFGAIEETTAIVPLLMELKRGTKMLAMLAPSYAGQFGAKVKNGQIVTALKKMGFAGVCEAAYGADIVSVAEGDEFAADVPDKRKFMTTSCCPAFVSMVEKYLPEMKGNISSVVSPMVAMGMYMKKQHSDMKIVFIGPCTAKKAEAKKYPDVIDYVITFDELASMMAGIGIDLATEPESEGVFEASQAGNLFALSGGVAKAVTKYLAAAHPQKKGDLESCSADGLANCRNLLKQIADGKLKANFVEGMACTGGCVGGPGAIADSRVTSKLVERQAATLANVSAIDVEAAKNEAKSNDKLHLKHEM
jgi:iron only hydrogenase large subunit-like protein